MRYDPDYHYEIVRNYRWNAKIPDSIADQMIYDKIMLNDIHISSSKTDGENMEEINFLRQELGLLPLGEN